MAASDAFRKFLVLQWKTLLQKKRHYILTVLEIVIPSLLFIVMVVLRVKGDGAFSPTMKPAVINDPMNYVDKYCR
jgi:hypothetical protein